MNDILTQENLDEGHAELDQLIKRTDRARRAACKQGRVQLRNQLAEGQAHLLMAYSVLGGIDDGEIRPKSGDK